MIEPTELHALADNELSAPEREALLAKLRNDRQALSQLIEARLKQGQ